MFIERKIEYHRRVGVPIWNGEFGPVSHLASSLLNKTDLGLLGKVYANLADGADWEDINADRYQLLKDQLDIYKGNKISWSIWLYKDIGFQGMVWVLHFLCAA